MSKKTGAVQKTISYKGATPEKLFEIFMDAKKHGELIKARVTMNRKTGGKFSAFDGLVTGKNLLVVPHHLIVQTWRGSVWRKEDVDSILVLRFDKTPAGAQINMVHAFLPPQFEERWDELYREPLRSYLKKEK